MCAKTRSLKTLDGAFLPTRIPGLAAFYGHVQVGRFPTGSVSTDKLMRAKGAGVRPQLLQSTIWS